VYISNLLSFSTYVRYQMKKVNQFCFVLTRSSLKLVFMHNDMMCAM